MGILKDKNIINTRVVYECVLVCGVHFFEGHNMKILTPSGSP